MKKASITMALGIAFILIFFVQSANAQTVSPAFSGRWKLNEEKSDFGSLSAKSFAGGDYLISLAQNDITIVSGDSTNRVTITIGLSGRPSHQVISKQINGIPTIVTHDVTVESITDKSIKYAINTPNQLPTASTKIFSLSADNKTLTVNYRSEFGQQVFAGTMVFDKVN